MPKARLNAATDITVNRSNKASARLSS